MTDNEIIKAFRCCYLNEDECEECPCFKDGHCTDVGDVFNIVKQILDFINRQQAEIDRLESILIGVMHFVDKWLDGAELEQDEVNRASAMREKTLQIVEKQQAEIERLLQKLQQPQVEAIKEFADRLKINYSKPLFAVGSYNEFIREVDNLVKEMVGEEK